MRRQDDTSEVLPDNVHPIRQEEMWNFDALIQPETAEGEKSSFTLEIGTWVEGKPTTVRIIPGLETKEEGMDWLRSIGYSWTYNIDHVGYLIDPTGKRVGQLDIFNHTYRVRDLETEINEIGRRRS